MPSRTCRCRNDVILFVADHCEYDVLILLDCSGSITSDGSLENWIETLNFTKALVTDIDSHSPIGTKSRVGVFSYSERVVQNVGLDENRRKDYIIQYIGNNQIDYQASTTHMLDAVQQAVTHLEATRRPTSSGLVATQILILFTDGRPFSFTNDAENSTNVMQILAQLMEHGTYVSMVGVNRADAELMEKIANYTTASGSSDFGRAVAAKNFTVLGSQAFAMSVVQPLNIDCTGELH